jgi:hypothetical protein
VRAERHLVGARHTTGDGAEELRDLVGRRVADRVGQVDRLGAGLDDRFDDLPQKRRIGAGRVLSRELHVVGMLARQLDRRHGQAQALLARDAQLALEVQVGSRDEHVDAAARRRRQRPAGLLDVLGMAARQRRDHRPLDVRGDHADRLGVGVGRNREARFDDVDAKRPQLPGQLELLVDPQRKTGRLLAVAQRRIEDGQPIAGHVECLLPTFVTGWAATSPIYSYLGMINLTYAAA